MFLQVTARVKALTERVIVTAVRAASSPDLQRQLQGQSTEDMLSALGL